MLAAIWYVALAMAAGSLMTVAALTVRRWVVGALDRRTARWRRRLLDALIAFPDGVDAESLARLFSVAPHRVAGEAAFEFLALVRGESHERVSDVLRRTGMDRKIARRLRWGNRADRTAAAERLAAFPGPLARQALRQALARDRSATVRVATAIALCELETIPPLDEVLAAIGPVGRRSRRLVELFRRVPAERSQELIDLAASEAQPVTVRIAAIEALSGRGELGLASELIRLAASDETGVQAAALRAIGRIGYPEAAPAARAALLCADWEVRIDAVWACGRIADPSLREPLAAMLDDPVWTVRQAAVRALSRFPDPRRDGSASAGSGGASGGALVGNLASGDAPRETRPQIFDEGIAA